MPVQKNCLVCGKEFTVANARAEVAKTCSRACKGQLQALEYAEQRVRSECAHCGKAMEASPSRIERGATYCCRACKDAHQRLKPFTDKAEDGDTVGSGEGYVYEYASGHPFASRGRVFQHRLVIERLMRVSAPDHRFLVEIHGVKYLMPGVDVHHKNEVRNDNSPTNLVACTKAAHKDMHEGRLPLAGETWPERQDALVAGPRTFHRTCEHCKGSFIAKRSEVMSGGGKFCSRTCFRASQGSSGLPAQVSVNCAVCGSGFTAKRHKVLAGHGRYCSNTCRIKFLATTHTKDK